VLWLVAGLHGEMKWDMWGIEETLDVIIDALMSHI